MQDDRFCQGSDVAGPESSGSPSLQNLEEKGVLGRVEERLGEDLDEEPVLNSFQAVQVCLRVDEEAQLAEMVDVLLSSRDLMSLVLLEKDRQRFKGALLQWTQLWIVFAVLTVSWTQPGPRPDAIKIFLPSIDSSLEFKRSCRLKMVP